MNKISQERGFAFLQIILLIGMLFVGTGVGVVATQKFDLFKEEAPKQTESTENKEIEQTPIEGAQSIDTPSTTISEEIIIESNSESAVDAQPTKVIKTETFVVSTPPTEVKVVQPVVNPIALAIENINADTTEDTATIIWETTLESDSRLILQIDTENKVMVSPNDGSKKHKVVIDGLTASTKFTFEIIATSAYAGEVSKFGSFSTTRVFESRYKSLMTNASTSPECTVIIIEDTAERPLVGATVNISGANYSGSGMRFLSDSVTEVTDKDGEVEYCHRASEIKLVISSIGYTFTSKEPDMNLWIVKRPD